MDGLLYEATRERERQLIGVTVAQVVDNVDQTGQGRVQVRLPWHASIQPWARVAVPVAGSSRGTFFLPQVGDEVLVAFDNGDVNTPYVVGSLWGGQDRPPITAPADAVNKQIIRTRSGLEIVIDDGAGEITISTPAKQKVKLDPQKIQLDAGEGAATLTLEASGQITLRASQGLTLDAPNLALRGTTIDIRATQNASLNGGAHCAIDAGLVAINS